MGRLNLMAKGIGEAMAPQLHGWTSDGKIPKYGYDERPVVMTIGNACSSAQRPGFFGNSSGKERDAETGLDYFLARYYSGAQGRFTSVDPIWVKADRLIDPQRLNLYSYTRNNPLKFIDPAGLDISMGSCPGGDIQKCFNLLQKGLSKEDRNHVRLIIGSGKNGFKIGEFVLEVDKEYVSKSGNFQALQKAANDHSALAKIDVLGKGEAVTIQTMKEWNRKTGVVLEKASMTMDGKENPFSGYTFFEYRGKDEGISYSAGKYTNIVINSVGELDITISQAMHHEIRHVILGDFGRSVPNGRHSSTFNSDQIPKNNIDRESLEAEKEVIPNAKQ
jgi:RHS repeat-associated protein